LFTILVFDPMPSVQHHLAVHYVHVESVVAEDKITIELPRIEAFPIHDLPPIPDLVEIVLTVDDYSTVLVIVAQYKLRTSEGFYCRIWIGCYSKYG
jgi:hypothetical protein